MRSLPCVGVDAEEERRETWRARRAEKFFSMPANCVREKSARMHVTKIGLPTINTVGEQVVNHTLSHALQDLIICGNLVHGGLDFACPCTRSFYKTK